MTFIFWLLFFLLVYSFFGYGLVLLVLSRLRGHRKVDPDFTPPSVSFLIAAYNESPVIADKLRNTLSLDPGGARLEIIVVSDGSDDGTADVARSIQDDRITVLEPGRLGKAAALGHGLEHCSGDIVVFSDANAILEPGSLRALLCHYSDPDVGGVCGQITIAKSKGGIGSSESLFWRYDQALKLAESRLGGAVSAQGSVYSLRRELAAQPAAGCTDDFVISTAAVAAGKRLIFEPNARTSEIVTESVSSEMRRRVRSSERGWRSIIYRAGLMNPFRHGWYAWQLFSHKFIRRLNPFLLILFLAVNLALIGHGWFYDLMAVCQVLFYLMALAGLLRPALRRIKPIGIATFFVFAHAALFFGFMRYARGQKSVLWTPSR